MQTQDELRLSCTASLRTCLLQLADRQPQAQLLGRPILLQTVRCAPLLHWAGQADSKP